MKVFKNSTGASPSRTDLALASRGLIAETFTLNDVQTLTNPTAGLITGGLVGLAAGDVISKISVGVGTAGAGTAPTLIKLGLVDSSGNVVAVSADQSANAAWTAFGIATITLAASYTVTTSGGYYPCFLIVGAFGTTALALTRNNNNGVSGLSVNGGKQQTVARSTGGATDLTGPITWSASPGSGNAIWFGVS